MEERTCSRSEAMRRYGARSCSLLACTKGNGSWYARSQKCTHKQTTIYASLYLRMGKAHNGHQGCRVCKQNMCGAVHTHGASGWISSSSPAECVLCVFASSRRSVHWIRQHLAASILLDTGDVLCTARGRTRRLVLHTRRAGRSRGLARYGHDQSQSLDQLWEFQDQPWSAVSRQSPTSVRCGCSSLGTSGDAAGPGDGAVQDPASPAALGSTSLVAAPVTWVM